MCGRYVGDTGSGCRSDVCSFPRANALPSTFLPQIFFSHLIFSPIVWSFEPGASQQPFCSFQASPHSLSVQVLFFEIDGIFRQPGISSLTQWTSRGTNARFIYPTARTLDFTHVLTGLKKVSFRTAESLYLGRGIDSHVSSVSGMIGMWVWRNVVGSSVCSSFDKSRPGHILTSHVHCFLRWECVWCVPPHTCRRGAAQSTSEGEGRRTPDHPPGAQVAALSYGALSRPPVVAFDVVIRFSS